MTDTPDHIKKIQLQIWLSKPPMERLMQFLRDNDEQFQFWNQLKENIKGRERTSTGPNQYKEFEEVFFAG